MKKNGLFCKLKNNGDTQKVCKGNIKSVYSYGDDSFIISQQYEEKAVGIWGKISYEPFKPMYINIPYGKRKKFSKSIENV